MIVNLPYFGAEFETERATFRPASTDLEHALPWLAPDTGGRIWVIDTQIIPPVSGSSHRQPPMRDKDLWKQVKTSHVPFQTPLQSKLIYDHVLL